MLKRYEALFRSFDSHGMNAGQNVQNPFHNNWFKRLRLSYLLALTAIAVSIISGQFFIQRHLRQQDQDAHTINIAGRQRMLVQQIAKSALQVSLQDNPAARTRPLRALRQAGREWAAAGHALHDAPGPLLLTRVRSPEMDELLNKSRPHQQAITAAVNEISNRLQEQPDTPAASLLPAVQQILAHEDSYLRLMDKAVDQLEQLAESKVNQLKNTEYLLLGISLSVILLEILFIFIPTTKRIQQTLQRLIRSEQDAQQMSREIGALYNSLEVSYEKISAISLPVSPPRLIAKADHGGNLSEVMPFYRQQYAPDPNRGGVVAHLFGLAGEAADDFMENLIDHISNGDNWQQEMVFKNQQGEKKYMEIHVIPICSQAGEISEWHILAADHTLRRIAEQNLHQKNRAEIDRKINEQKFRSILVLEGQEEERKRIAMNIHDGIGQMLTSLKFHLASINPVKPEEAGRKLNDINQLVGEVIQEVRRVTFNLKPPVLTDYGLAAGLKNLVHEIDRISGVSVVFDNRSNFTQRLSSKTENNLFRIVQEALNNAIKYAGSARIDVVLEHDAESLMIAVKDYGRGFDMQAVDVLQAESGYGLLNMRERAAYIDGTLEIESGKDVGTIVKLFVPLVQN